MHGPVRKYTLARRCFSCDDHDDAGASLYGARTFFLPSLAAGGAGPDSGNKATGGGEERSGKGLTGCDGAKRRRARMATSIYIRAKLEPRCCDVAPRLRRTVSMLLLMLMMTMTTTTMMRGLRGMGSQDNRNQISQVLASARGIPCCGIPPHRQDTTRHDSTRLDTRTSSLPSRQD